MLIRNKLILRFMALVIAIQLCLTGFIYYYSARARELRFYHRLEGKAEATKTAIGHTPTAASLDLDGLKIDGRDLDILLSADIETWKQEASLMPAHLESFGEHLPKELWDEYHALVARLNDEF
jgi:GTP-dependent phosphoenolpyruvate carboxykinase